jgi:hypothetical protein
MGKDHRRSLKRDSQGRALIHVTSGTSGSADLRPGNDAITIGVDNSINIDLMKLQAPNNVYDADYAWIVHRRPGNISLFFGKRDIGSEDTLRTRLELRYPPENLVQHWKILAEFYERVQKFIEKWPIDDLRNKQQPEEWKSERDHSEWANFETIAHTGTQSSIDFYSLAPYGVAQFRRGLGSSQLMVTPIARVQMTTFELARLLNSIAETVAEIEGYLPRPTEGEDQAEHIETEEEG